MLEVCVDTVQAAIAAEKAGAQRIELCAALDIGGVTPPKSLINAVRRRIACPLVVLIRPRAGDFVYDALDFQQTLEAITDVLDCNVQGVVVGGLDDQGQLDVSLLRAIRQQVPEHFQLVMHRAFDFVRDVPAALEQLVWLRFTRILTAGGDSGSACHNLAPLKSLVELAAGRIQIMPGGGLTVDGARRLIQATGCCQLHGSFRKAITSGVGSGSEPRPADFGTSRAIDAEAIARVRALLEDAENQR